MAKNFKPNGGEEWLKVGAALPGTAAEIIHLTNDGENMRLTGITADPEDPNSYLATLYRANLNSGEATAEHGQLKRTHIREAAGYVWERRKGISKVSSAMVAVALGTLWVRHKKNH